MHDTATNTNDLQQNRLGVCFGNNSTFCPYNYYIKNTRSNHIPRP